VQLPLIPSWDNRWNLFSRQSHKKQWICDHGVLEELGYFLQIVILRFPVSLNVHSVHAILAALLKCYTSLEPILWKRSRNNRKNTFSAVLSHECYFVGNPFFNLCYEAHCMFLWHGTAWQDHTFVGQVPPAVPYDGLALHIHHPPVDDIYSV